MGALDLIELLLRGPVGGPQLGVAVACLTLATSIRRPDGASADRVSRSVNGLAVEAKTDRGVRPYG